jgi:hypothetical protein
MLNVATVAVLVLKVRWVKRAPPVQLDLKAILEQPAQPAQPAQREQLALQV